MEDDASRQPTVFIGRDIETTIAEFDFVNGGHLQDSIEPTNAAQENTDINPFSSPVLGTVKPIVSPGGLAAPIPNMAEPSPARIRSDLGASSRPTRVVSTSAASISASNSQSQSPSVGRKRGRPARNSTSLMNQNTHSTTYDGEEDDEGDGDGGAFSQQHMAIAIDEPTTPASRGLPRERGRSARGRSARGTARGTTRGITRGTSRGTGRGTTRRTATARESARGNMSNGSGRLSARLLARSAASPVLGTPRITKARAKQTLTSGRGLAGKRGRGRPKGHGAAKKAGAQEFEIEKIVDEQVDQKSNEPQYLVKWRGYSAKQNTWEPRENLTNCEQVMKAFQASRGTRGSTRGSARGGRGRKGRRGGA